MDDMDNSPEPNGYIVICRSGDGVEYVGPFETDGAAHAWIAAHPEREYVPPRPMTYPEGLRQ